MGKEWKGTKLIKTASGAIILDVYMAEVNQVWTSNKIEDSETIKKDFFQWLKSADEAYEDPKFWADYI